MKTYLHITIVSLLIGTAMTASYLFGNERGMNEVKEDNAIKEQAYTKAAHNISSAYKKRKAIK